MEEEEEKAHDEVNDEFESEEDKKHVRGTYKDFMLQAPTACIIALIVSVQTTPEEKQ